MLNQMKDIIEDVKNGKPVIVIDDETRENEGDIVIAAEHATPENINFMIKYARGLVCVPMSAEFLDKLKLPPMRAKNDDPYATAWMMSVDAKEGVTTGISASDRAKTVEKLIDDDTKLKDFTCPGHLFPLRAVDGGVLKRSGHTEAAVDLAKLAGLKPAGVICEIIRDDGEMARLPDLKKFAEKHQLKICSIEDLVEFVKKK